MTLSKVFKDKVKEVLGNEFPDDAKVQLEGSIKAVFKSWNGKKLSPIVELKVFRRLGNCRKRSSDGIWKYG